MPLPNRRAKKKQPKRKSPAVKSLVARIEASTPEERKLKDRSAFIARMRELFNFTTKQLDRLATAADTPCSDLIIIRMLWHIHHGGSIPHLAFYLDSIFGDARLIPGGDPSDLNSAPVQVFQLPANGSEVDDDI